MKYLRNSIVLGIVLALCALYSYGSWSDELYNENIDPSSYGKTVEIVKQPFVATQTKIDQFRIMLSVLEQADWQLVDVTTNQVVAQGQFEKGINQTGAWYTANTEVEVTMNQPYAFVVRAKETQHPIGVHIVPSSNHQFVTLNEHEEIEGTVAMAVSYQYFDTETFIVMIGLCGYVWFFIKFLQKLFK